MATVLERVLIVFCTITATFAVLMLRGNNRRLVENRIFSYYCIGSSIWSLFFGELLAQTDAEAAYICRCIGMIGTFGSLICISILLSIWSGVRSWIKHYIIAFSMLGLIIYPFNIRRESIIFHETKLGMSYEFVPDIWGSIYSYYSVILSVNLFILIIFMIRKGSKKRVRKMGHLLIVCLVTILLGSVFDTILPLFGYAAIPGSTITQFFGSIVVFKVLLYYNKSLISVKNMTGYIYHSMKAAILVYNDREELMIASDGAEELLNITEQKNRDTRLLDMFTLPEDILISGERTKTVEADYRQGELSCSIEINRLYDEYDDIIGYIVVISDITERTHFIKELDNERKRANEANAAKSSFLANTSHEIRTPINTVLGMNEMILRETKSPAVRGYAANIKGAGESLLSIINDILDFSKVEAGMMEIIENEYLLTDMLKSMINMFMLKTEEKGLEFRLEISEDLPEKLFGDEMRIRQVITNLLSNAVKYTEKGSITFYLNWTRRNDTANLCFEVKDTGIGIKKEDKEALFDSFTRLDQKLNHHIEGTGLGLSIACNLAKLMNGKLEVQSEYGKGSVFSFCVDQRIISDIEIGNIRTLLDQIPQEPEGYMVSFTAPEARILVVDDNMMNLEVIKGLLKKTRIKLDTVTSGMGCIEAVQSNTYQIILLDHMMPIMDGIETLKKLRTLPGNKSADAVIIVLTANAIHGAREMYMNAGFDDYLSKPVESRLLEKTIYEYLPKQLIIENTEEQDEALISELISAASSTKTIEAKEAANYDEENIRLLEQPDLRRIADMLEPYGIDLLMGLHYCGNLNIYTKTAEAYIMSVPGTLEGLQAYRVAEDRDNYRILIHSVKSNAKTLGSKGLYEYAYAQEKSCAAGEFSIITADGDKPEHMIMEMAVGLSACIKDKDKDTDSERIGTLLSQDTVKFKVCEIIGLLEDFDDEGADKKLQELLEGVREEELRNSIQQAAILIKQYKYDEAKDLLATMG